MARRGPALLKTNPVRSLLHSSCVFYARSAASWTALRLWRKYVIPRARAGSVCLPAVSQPMVQQHSPVLVGRRFDRPVLRYCRPTPVIAAAQRIDRWRFVVVLAVPADDATLLPV